MAVSYYMIDLCPAPSAGLRDIGNPLIPVKTIWTLLSYYLVRKRTVHDDQVDDHLPQGIGRSPAAGHYRVRSVHRDGSGGSAICGLLGACLLGELSFGQRRRRPYRLGRGTAMNHLWKRFHKCFLRLAGDAYSLAGLVAGLSLCQLSNVSLLAPG